MFYSKYPSHLLQFSSLFLFYYNYQEKLYGKPIILADREMVEEKAGDILSEAQHSHVAFLVVGDPFGYDTSVIMPMTLLQYLIDLLQHTLFLIF